MTPRLTGFALLSMLALGACATAPATRPGAMPSPAAQSVASAAADSARVRDAALQLGTARPGYRACVETAAAAAAATQACLQAEMQYQQGRLDTALATRRAGVDAAQAQWLVERDRLCGVDGAHVAIEQRIQAGICRLEATAARADALAR